MQKRQKYLDSLPWKIKLHILDILNKLGSHQWEWLDISPLQGKVNMFRCRYGKLRIIFEIKDNHVEIINIWPRGDIYKN